MEQKLSSTEESEVSLSDSQNRINMIISIKDFDEENGTNEENKLKNE